VKPAALSLPDGGFVVVYSGYRAEEPAASADILLRQFDAAGNPLGGEFLVNNYTTGLQTSPCIAAHARGFVVAWESDGQDGDSRGIYARTFTVASVPGDMNGDGVVDVADVFYLINFLFAGGPAPVG
jgi:hypothetical protein